MFLVSISILFQPIAFVFGPVEALEALCGGEDLVIQKDKNALVPIFIPIM
jgi:hypothetical protein